MKKLSFICFLWLFSVSLIAQGYNITVTIDGLSDTSIILGHYFAKQSFIIKDTVILDKKGKGTVSGKENLPGGVYSFVAGNTRLFDFLINEEQQFEITTDTLDYTGHRISKGNTEDEMFMQYQRFLGEQSKVAKEINDKYMAAENEKEKDKLRKQLTKINDDVKARQQEIVEENEGTLLSKFIKATLEIVVPEAPKDADPNYRYYYYKDHYFDNFDYTDARLLRSPIYENKFLNYFTKVIPQIPDTINHEIDKIVGKTKEDKDVYGYCIRLLFNHYVKSEMMGTENIWVHLADKYYLTGELEGSGEEFVKNLEKRANEVRHNMIGEQGRNSQFVFIDKHHFIEAAEDTAIKNDVYEGAFFNLYDIKAKFTILYFWAADCGHCKKGIPKLHSMYVDSLKSKDVAVIAVHIVGAHKGKRMWVDFVNEHQVYEWINAWNPYSFDYKDDYDVQTSNVVYLLDENKTIIGKRISYEQAAEIIEFELAKEKKK